MINLDNEVRKHKMKLKNQKTTIENKINKLNSQVKEVRKIMGNFLNS